MTYGEHALVEHELAGFCRRARERQRMADDDGFEAGIETQLPRILGVRRHT